MKVVCIRPYGIKNHFKVGSIYEVTEASEIAIRKSKEVGVLKYYYLYNYKNRQHWVNKTCFIELSQYRENIIDTIIQ